MHEVDPSPDETLVHSYRFLRWAIGGIGMALPLVLIVGKYALDRGPLLSSISGYYYSDMRGVFVGSMCAIGVFLLSYHGYARGDDVAGTIAGAAAIVLALFPTTPAGHFDGRNQIIGAVHAISAGTFFALLAAFCLYFFPRNKEQEKTGEDQKDWRNRAYILCGSIIVACLVLALISGLAIHNSIGSLHPLLVLESVAIFAFGAAWFVRGQTVSPRRKPEQSAQSNITLDAVLPGT
jgi:hypothetical protein